MRICKPKSIMRTEHYGGSETTLVDAREAKEGRATGLKGGPFRQNIHVSSDEIQTPVTTHHIAVFNAKAGVS